MFLNSSEKKKKKNLFQTSMQPVCSLGLKRTRRRTWLDGDKKEGSSALLERRGGGGRSFSGNCETSYAAGNAISVCSEPWKRWPPSSSSSRAKYDARAIKNTSSGFFFSSSVETRWILQIITSNFTDWSNKSGEGIHCRKISIYIPLRFRASIIQSSSSSSGGAQLFSERNNSI